MKKILQYFITGIGGIYLIILIIGMFYTNLQETLLGIIFTLLPIVAISGLYFLNKSITDKSNINLSLYPNVKRLKSFINISSYLFLYGFVSFVTLIINYKINGTDNNTFFYGSNFSKFLFNLVIPCAFLFLFAETSYVLLLKRHNQAIYAIRFFLITFAIFILRSIYPGIRWFTPPFILDRWDIWLFRIIILSFLCLVICIVNYIYSTYRTDTKKFFSVQKKHLSIGTLCLFICFSSIWGILIFANLGYPGSKNNISVETNASNLIIGKWMSEFPEGNCYLTLKEDGTVAITGTNLKNKKQINMLNIKWSMKDDKLYISNKEEKGTAVLTIYSLDKSSLVIGKGKSEKNIFYFSRCK